MGVGFFEADGIAANFQREVVDPVRELAGRTIDVPAVLMGLLLPGTTVSQRVAAAYRRLLGTATLQDLPIDAEGPNS